MGQFGLLARSPIGIFVFDNDELLYYRLFSKNPEKALEEFVSLHENEIKAVLRKDVIESPTAYALLRKHLREYAKSLGFAESDAELNSFLSRFAYLLSKRKLATAISRDRLLIQSSNAAEDVSRAMNLFLERLYEWFSLHYPEVKNKDLAERVMTNRRRENFPGFSSSVGVDITKADEEMLVEFATVIQNLAEEKERMENYVKSFAKEIAPNISSLVDPMLAAKLIAHAGSLEKLARMPASTLQLIGAEKALFRHLKKKGKSPKYGIIFNTPYIQNALPEKKGKAARILASKLMQAARIDYYSGRVEEKLKKELDEEMKRI